MTGTGEPMAGARRLTATETQRNALEARKVGATYRQIASGLNITVSSAHKAVQVALRKTLQEPADDVRALELERLDAMLWSLRRPLADGHLGAIDRALKIMDRRAKLLGLDAPTKQQIAVAAPALEPAPLALDLSMFNAQELQLLDNLAARMEAAQAAQARPASEDDVA